MPIGDSFNHEVQVVFGGKGQPGIDEVATGGAVLILKQEEGELDAADGPQLPGDKSVTVATGADIVDCQLKAQLTGFDIDVDFAAWVTGQNVVTGELKFGKRL